jgi:hypothetical protein
MATRLQRSTTQIEAVHTGQVPWLALVEVGLADGARGEARVGGLPGEVVRDELLVGGVEPEPRGQLHALLPPPPLLLLVMVHVVLHLLPGY